PATSPLALPDALPISTGSAPAFRDSFVLDGTVRVTGAARERILAPFGLRVHINDGPQPPLLSATTVGRRRCGRIRPGGAREEIRSEEHTSELQSRENL